LGPYLLLERLGRGAQGDVWKAARLDAGGELVALKILNPGLRSSPARMAQFRREAERGRRLSGPSLLKINELVEIDGHILMSMPYVEGTPLRDVVFCRRSYLAGDSTDVNHAFAAMRSEEYCSGMIRLLARVARALARVHDQCIAHRDIKPANILLDNRKVGMVYLCDFGLGRDLEIATTEQMRDGAGTPMYMAPERLLKLAADEVKCDIYSLGVTIFESLTLERPFIVPGHLSAAALAPYLAGAMARRPRQISAGFPIELEEIVMKAMAPEPGRRFDSARELASELERFDLHASFRFSRASAAAPHWSRLCRSVPLPSGSSHVGRPHELAPLKPAYAPHVTKLAAVTISESEPGCDCRSD
jgi:serine/threonine-protein kinase